MTSRTLTDAQAELERFEQHVARLEAAGRRLTSSERSTLQHLRNQAEGATRPGHGDRFDQFAARVAPDVYEARARKVCKSPRPSK